MTKRPPLLAGNWKMHGSRERLRELEAIDAAAGALGTAAEIAFFLPAPLLPLATRFRGLAIGGQDCHPAAEGAFTGSISAALIADAGAAWVLLGHSETRRDQRLDDAQVAARISAATPLLSVMLCVGEERRDQPPEQVARQLDQSLAGDADPARLAIAYEPVWAIGSGETPTPRRIAETHRHLRDALAARFGPANAQIRILYGGSVSAGNAGEILAAEGVDGVLIGGASLTAARFLPIMAALRPAQNGG